MSNKTLISLATAALFMNVTVQAEVVDLPPVSTFGELDQLRSQNAILTEAVKNAELKNKLNQISKEDHSGYTSMNPSIPKQAQVELVSGFGNKMTARIGLPDGGSAFASIGTKIPGVGVVKSISVNHVVVEHNRQLTSLPFAGQGISLDSGALSPSSSTSRMPGGR